MEESTKKHPKEEKRENKKKWPGHGEKRKGNSGGNGRKRLDAQTVGYFRRVSDMLNEGFNGDEEKGKVGEDCVEVQPLLVLSALN